MLLVIMPASIGFCLATRRCEVIPLRSPRYFCSSRFCRCSPSATVAPPCRQTVEIARSLTDHQFSELFAIAQAAPGPNIMFVALLGHFIAGAPGAVIATVAMCGPSCVLACAVAQVVERFRKARWRIAIQAGLVPVTIGLIAASALIIVRGADRNWASLAITATTFAVVYWTRLSPLVVFACAALLGLVGFV